MLENKKNNKKENDILRRNKQKKRKGKDDINGRIFHCKICKKSYLSYPALYTHNRNKHDIIPITDKPNIFTSKRASTNKFSFKYNQINLLNHNNEDVSKEINFIINAFKNMSLKYVLNKNSKFFKNNYQFNNDPFFIILSNNYNNINQNNLIPKKDNNIYQVIIIYLIRLIKITYDEEFKYLLINVAYFLREYLNMIGWDFKQNLMYFKKENINLNNTKDFCFHNTCEEIPEMIEDFVSIYLLLIDDLRNKQKEVADVCQNFICWLFINQLTSYKLKRIND